MSVISRPPPSPVSSALQVTSDNGGTPLHYAAYNGHAQAVQTLVKLGANIEVKHTRNPTLNLNLTPYPLPPTPSAKASEGCNQKAWCVLGRMHMLACGIWFPATFTSLSCFFLPCICPCVYVHMCVFVTLCVCVRACLHVCVCCQARNKFHQTPLHLAAMTAANSSVVITRHLS